MLIKDYKQEKTLPKFYIIMPTTFIHELASCIYTFPMSYVPKGIKFAFSRNISKSNFLLFVIQIKRFSFFFLISLYNFSLRIVVNFISLNLFFITIYFENIVIYCNFEIYSITDQDWDAKS